MKYDYIIGGAGCAGLTLAYLINQSGLKNKKILLIDIKKKVRNDRTFCFWEQGDKLFGDIVFKEWQKLLVKNGNQQKTFGLDTYSYKMIRGIDLYKYTKEEIFKNPNIHFAHEKILGYSEKSGCVRVKTEKNEYFSEMFFNSIPELVDKMPHKGYNFLTQHFLGWFIETDTDNFDPGTATFMDFSVPQNGGLRFCYVLPYSKKGALVEYTIFSKQILKAKEYQAELENYIANNLKIKNYKITHKEFGKIAMTDRPFNKTIGERIVNIGVPSGGVKPSCGFAFNRIVQHTRFLVDCLEKNSKPEFGASLWEKRFRLYDSTFLNVFSNQNIRKNNVMYRLFKRNHICQIFRLLDEKTNVFQEIRIFVTVHVGIFLKAILAELGKYIKRKFFFKKAGENALAPTGAYGTSSCKPETGLGQPAYY